MPPRFLTALPVYNEVDYVDSVLDEVKQYSEATLVVDDGSTDGTAERLARRGDVKVVAHAQNRGYGAALATAFSYALRNSYDVLVTIDCDGQHEPQRIPQFVAACTSIDRVADIVSGSRYLQQFEGDDQPPEQRRSINRKITDVLNRDLGLDLTDAFCGFKAYRASALEKLSITETGYGMPLEVWVQVARAGLRVIELPVPLVYLDESRSFGGALDDGSTRLDYYHQVMDRATARAGRRRQETERE